MNCTSIESSVMGCTLSRKLEEMEETEACCRGLEGSKALWKSELLQAPGSCTSQPGSRLPASCQHAGTPGPPDLRRAGRLGVRGSQLLCSA